MEFQSADFTILNKVAKMSIPWTFIKPLGKHAFGLLSVDWCKKQRWEDKKTGGRVEEGRTGAGPGTDGVWFGLKGSQFTYIELELDLKNKYLKIQAIALKSINTLWTLNIVHTRCSTVWYIYECTHTSVTGYSTFHCNLQQNGDFLAST